MTAINDKDRIDRYRCLVSEMMADRVQFKADWLSRKGWKVVPTENGMHFTEEELASIVRGLRQAGFHKCFALASEDLDPFPSCYGLSINEEDFREFNRACGPFWFLLTDDSLSWAISCNNAYNLYAAGPPLLERLLNKSISKAREEFHTFAVELAHGNADYPPLRIAEHYEGV